MAFVTTLLTHNPLSLSAYLYTLIVVTMLTYTPLIAAYFGCYLGNGPTLCTRSCISSTLSGDIGEKYNHKPKIDTCMYEDKGDA